MWKTEINVSGSLPNRSTDDTRGTSGHFYPVAFMKTQVSPLNILDFLASILKNSSKQGEFMRQAPFNKAENLYRAEAVAQDESTVTQYAIERNKKRNFTNGYSREFFRMK